MSSLDWIAGCFEGEGTISISKPRGRCLCALTCSVGNTDKEMLLPFLESWPANIKSRPQKKRHREHWVWRIQANRALDFLLTVLPFLKTSRVKQKAVLAIEFQRQKDKRVKNSRRIKDFEYRDRQVVFYQKMKLLNVRGVRG